MSEVMADRYHNKRRAKAWLSARRLRIIAIQIVLCAILFVVWQMASGTLVPKFFVSKPTLIFERLLEWTLDGSLFFHMGITAAEAFLGFVVGGTLGTLVGIALGRSQFFGELLNPFIMALYSLPKVALAPLFILWLGIGIEMKVALTATIVFFLVFLNTYTGVRGVSREMVAIISLMGANERHILTKVVLPSAFTWVFAGLRISAPYALIGAIVGELMGSNQGLGALLSNAQGNFDTAGVFAALIAITVLSSILNLIVRTIESWAMPWKAEEREASI
jgi:NitT/TauT family transport system permease protein